MQPDIKEIEAGIEAAVGELYTGFHRLHKAEAYQVEYDNMGALLLMRLHILKTYKVKP